MKLEFGIWDHFERLAGIPSSRQYAERIELIAYGESLGFSGYHVAEHHLSPLSMAPSPLTFLAALSQRTTTMRIGPMVVIFPLYPPIRLIEELCMVDALSNGRLEIGVGRGIRDVEHEWFGHDPARTRDEFACALETVRNALMNGHVDISPAGTNAIHVPLVHEPTQLPTPPFWYVGNWRYAAEQGMSALAVRPTRADVDEFWSIWEERRAASSPLHADRIPKIGATRPVYVAPTDDAAEVVARRAWATLGDHFWATDTRVAGRPIERGATGESRSNDLATARKSGSVLYGSPERVRHVLGDFLDQAGPRFNYLVSGFQWGDLTHEEARRSMELFASEVAPALSERHAALA